LIVLILPKLCFLLPSYLLLSISLSFGWSLNVFLFYCSSNLDLPLSIFYWFTIICCFFLKPSLGVISSPSSASSLPTFSDFLDIFIMCFAKSSAESLFFFIFLDLSLILSSLSLSCCFLNFSSCESSETYASSNFLPLARSPSSSLTN